ncbi:MAG: DUF4203 domain-containing protein [Desulfobacteraceae bacterium]|jgi:hypothetical protein|nr:DUF4203 domain-containing protein [Desulfobacteraceae bacterium]
MLMFSIVIGLVLLLFGRKLFWLLVAVSGFMVGVQFSQMLFPDYSQWIQLTIALGIGAVSALVAILVQRIAFVLAGFMAGIFMVLMATQFFGFNDFSAFWIVLGGAAGAVAGYIFIDWAIIVLSAMIGAGVIVNVLIGVLRLPPAISIIFFMVLSVIGAVVQMRLSEDIADGN